MPTIDTNTDIGKVRVLISDLGGQDGQSFLYEDDEINVFLELRNNNIRRAAATALRAIANNEAQTGKVIRFLDLQTDMAKVANSLRELAKELEAEADRDTGWTIAQMPLGVFAKRDILRRRAQTG